VRVFLFFFYFVTRQNFEDNIPKTYPPTLVGMDRTIDFNLSLEFVNCRLEINIKQQCHCFAGVKRFGERIWVPEFWCCATAEERQRTLNQIEKVAPGRAKLSAFNMKPSDIVEHIKAPRIFKTHLPFYLLNPNTVDTCKVICIARNPEDNCVSYYYYHKAMPYCEYNGDFEKFVDFYIRGEVQFAPYWDHIT